MEGHAIRAIVVLVGIWEPIRRAQPYRDTRVITDTSSENCVQFIHQRFGADEKALFGF